MSDIRFEAHATVDARGLQCPLPIIRVKKALSSVAVGETLEILTTDPGSISDVAAWTRSTGHELVHMESEKSPFKFWIRRQR